MKINRAIFSLCVVFGTGSVCGSGRFYVGVEVLGNLKHSKISLNDDYWGSVVKEVYRDSISENDKKIINLIKGLATGKESNASSAPYYANSSLPSDLLQDELYKQGAGYYDENSFGPGFSVTFGAFCLRKKNILAAVEITGSRAFQTEKATRRFKTTFAKLPWQFDDEIIKKIKDDTTFEDNGNTYKKVDGNITITIKQTELVSRLNPSKNTRAPLSFIQIPDIDTTMTLEIKETFSSRLLLRVGTVLNDRVYLYVQLGGEMTRFHFKLNQIADKNFGNMYFAYNSEYYSSATPSSPTLTFIINSLSAAEDATPENTKLTCNQSVTRLAIVGGIGTEFFLNRRLSARLDATVSFGPDTLVNTDRSAKLRYSELHGQAGLGLVWRF